MRNISFQVLAIAFLLAVTAVLSFGQQGKTETIITSDPAPVALKSLFEQADLVAFVKILSGDAEHYNAAIYKAEVSDAYKGIKEKEIIYFGPFISYAVGNEYLVFLRKTGKHVGEFVDTKEREASLPYNATHSYYSVMYDGYSVMPVSYECVFDKSNAYSDCDYAVKFNIYQIPLPVSLKAFPKEDKDGLRPDVKWARRKEIESTLLTLRNNQR